MPALHLNLSGVAPGQAPAREDVAEAAGAQAVVVRGAVPALASVLATLLRAGRLADVPVAWEPGDDDASAGLARDLGVGSGGRRPLPLVRDERGGVLLRHGRVEPTPADGGEVPRLLGLQAYHDALRVADGPVRAIDVRPDWAAVDVIEVRVSAGRLRRARRSTGRALQVACDPARILRDGVPLPRPVSRWTWYADSRVRWVLQP